MKILLVAVTFLALSSATPWTRRHMDIHHLDLRRSLPGPPAVPRPRSPEVPLPVQRRSPQEAPNTPQDSNTVSPGPSKSTPQFEVPDPQLDQESEMRYPDFPESESANGVMLVPDLPEREMQESEVRTPTSSGTTPKTPDSEESDSSESSERNSIPQMVFQQTFQPKTQELEPTTSKQTTQKPNIMITRMYEGMKIERIPQVEVQYVDAKVAVPQSLQVHNPQQSESKFGLLSEVHNFQYLDRNAEPPKSQDTIFKTSDVAPSISAVNIQDLDSKGVQPLNQILQHTVVAQPLYLNPSKEYAIQVAHNDDEKHISFFPMDRDLSPVVQKKYQPKSRIAPSAVFQLQNEILSRGVDVTSNELEQIQNVASRELPANNYLSQYIDHGVKHRVTRRTFNKQADPIFATNTRRQAMDPNAYAPLDPLKIIATPDGYMLVKDDNYIPPETHLYRRRPFKRLHGPIFTKPFVVVRHRPKQPIEL